MQLSQRIFAFAQLGRALLNLSPERKAPLYSRARAANPWFTPENIDFAIHNLATNLTEEKLHAWTDKYQLSTSPSKKVGVVMAGNIPLVGFHDFLAVLISGHTLLAKLSSQDDILIRFLADILIQEDAEWKEKIHFIDRLQGMDAVIATGSDNSSRYFRYYFGKYPHIIRKNRTSVAILDGTESPQDLWGLGEDMFRYFGMGCRNVAKIYVPEDFEPPAFIEHLLPWKEVIEHHKYANNYDYNRSVYLLKQVPFWEGGFFLLLESKELFSPLSVLYFEHYASRQNLEQELTALSDSLQCIVGHAGIPNAIPFGMAQKPGWHDYADQIDTLEFLQQL